MVDQKSNVEEEQEPLEEAKSLPHGRDASEQRLPQGHDEIPKRTTQEQETQTAEKRKRRRETWEKAKQETERFDLHRGLGNILRRAEDLFVEVRMWYVLVFLLTTPL